MSLSVGNFYCKTCKIAFEGEYKPQKRPRKSCPKCHKMVDMAINKRKTRSTNKLSTETKGRQHSTTPLIPSYPDVNIKTLIKKWSIHQLYTDSKFSGQALQALTKPEFIEQGEIKHGIYWTSETPPYRRPDWLYPWQPYGIDLLRGAHAMYLGSRQKIGKTMTAALADIEDCLENPGFVVTLVAPRRDLAAKLLRQMFKETIKIKKVERVGNKFKITPTDEKFNLWTMFEPYVLKDNILEKVFKNGSRIQVITLDYASVQGLAADVIHIEEFDKVVRLTKEGGRSDKIEALAGLLPQIRSNPNAKIRITCNNASGLFRVLRDRLYPFGMYFPIYMEVPRPGEKFAGIHYIHNEDAIWTNDEGVPSVPDVDDILEVLMGALMGQGYVKMQLHNVDSFIGELFNPDKVEIAYDKGKKVVSNPNLFDYTGKGCDPGGAHATAFTTFGLMGSEVVHLHSHNFYSADEYDKKRFDSKLEEQSYLEAEDYCVWHCQFIATESNSGFKNIAPYMGAMVKKLLDGYEYIRKKWVKTDRFSYGKSRAAWRIIWSNFGGEKPEGPPARNAIPKNEFVTTLRFLFDLEMITLQERNEHEQQFRIDLSLYDPSLSAEKYKGDQVESGLHVIYHLVKKNKEFQAIVQQYKKLKIEAL